MMPNWLVTIVLSSAYGAAVVALSPPQIRPIICLIFSPSVVVLAFLLHGKTNTDKV